MNSKPIIGIIGGNGWLGRIMIEAMLGAGLVSADQLLVTGRTSENRTAAKQLDSNQDLVRLSDIVILSVRPDQFTSLQLDAAGKLIISVMAGVTVDSLKRQTASERIIRSIPSAAAEIRKSYTPWVASDGATSEDRAIAGQVFSCFGLDDECPSEDLLDYMTGLSGSAQAIPALLASAMLDHARARGLPDPMARRAVHAVIAGASHLTGLPDHHPDMVVNAFIDYKGTTAALLQTMKACGFESAVAKGLEQAELKARAMAEAARSPR